MSLPTSLSNSPTNISSISQEPTKKPENSSRYQEKISTICKFPSESSPQNEIAEGKIHAFTNNPEEGSIATFPDCFKTHTIANNNILQNLESQEKIPSTSLFASQLERKLSKKVINSTAELQLPVVNMEDFNSADPIVRAAFIQKFRDAITTNGFIAIQNVGIDPATIEESYAQSKQFFEKPMEFKEEISGADVDYQRGYKFGEKAKGALVPDKKEFIHIGSELSERMKNKWPNQPGFQDAMTRMYEALAGYVIPLLEATVEAINLGVEKEEDKIPTSYFTEKMGLGANSLLRTIHYPAISEEEKGDPANPSLGAAAHTDIDLLTILPPATAKGLQIQVDGKWYNVIVPSDSFVVNMGDMFSHITNNLVKSAIHRVLAGERQSQVFFAHPLDGTDLTPLAACIEQTGGAQLYAKSNRLELLFERLIELFGDRVLLGIYARMGHIERQMEYEKESPEVLRLLTDSGYILGTWNQLDQDLKNFKVPIINLTPTDSSNLDDEIKKRLEKITSLKQEIEKAKLTRSATSPQLPKEEKREILNNLRRLENELKNSEKQQIKIKSIASVS